jgi:UDP-N-acetylglucosamine 3-dehydrogenase
MIKVGVIGLGAMGSNHVRVYSQLNCDLVGVADNDPNRAKEIGRSYDIPYFTDYHELLSKVDAVSVVVPTTLHHKVAIDCLKSGVHCLVEKPIAFKISEAMEMIETADRCHVNLAVGHIERFNPAVQIIKKIVDQNTLGNLLFVSTRRLGPFSPRIRDVGIVVDSATHDIDIVKYLIGKEPENIYSKIRKVDHVKEDEATIVMEFGATKTCVEVSWLLPSKVRTMVVIGTKGMAYLNYIDQTVTIVTSQGKTNIPVIKAEPLKQELQNYLDSVSNRKSARVDGNDGAAVLKIALQAEKDSDSSTDTSSKVAMFKDLSRKISQNKTIVAIPCFNTDAFIEKIILKAKTIVDEVVVIDDGSSDMTATTAKNSGAIVSKHVKNKGYGEAIKSCFKVALENDADVIVTIDGDGQHNPDEISQLLYPILSGQADVVIGSRFLKKNNIPRYRRLGISVINYLWNFGSKVKLSDSQSGFRAYRKTVVQQLSLNKKGMSASIEIIEQLRAANVKIQEVPITCSYINNNKQMSIKAIIHGVTVAFSVMLIRSKLSLSRQVG